MKELREKIGMKKTPKMKVVGSRMRWAGHVQRRSKDRLSKRAWKAEEGGRRRPKLQWKDIVKRDLERAGPNGQEGKIIAEDRGRWRELTTKVEQATKWRGPHSARVQGGRRFMKTQILCIYIVMLWN